MDPLVEEKNVLPLLGFEPRRVQALASYCNPGSIDVNINVIFIFNSTRNFQGREHDHSLPHSASYKPMLLFDVSEIPNGTG